MLLRALALLWRGCSEPYKTLAGVVQNAHRSMSGIQRATQKTIKKRPRSFLDKGFCQERVKMRSWSAPGLVLEGFGRLPGASWVALGRSWAALGRSWAPLGRVLGASWVLLGPSWLPNAAPDGLGHNFSSMLPRFGVDFRGVRTFEACLGTIPHHRRFGRTAVTMPVVRGAPSSSPPHGLLHSLR